MAGALEGLVPVDLIGVVTHERGSRGRVYGDRGAAEALAVPPSTLESRIRRLGIDKHPFRRRAPGR